jgi:hypothetical protein
MSALAVACSTRKSIEDDAGLSTTDISPVASLTKPVVATGIL